MMNPAEAARTRDFRLKQSGTDGCGRQKDLTAQQPASGLDHEIPDRPTAIVEVQLLRTADISVHRMDRQFGHVMNAAQLFHGFSLALPSLLSPSLHHLALSVTTGRHPRVAGAPAPGGRPESE